MTISHVSDWIRNQAGQIQLGREFSFNFVLFGVTVVGAYVYGRLKLVGVTVLGHGVEVQW